MISESEYVCLFLSFISVKKKCSVSSFSIRIFRKLFGIIIITSFADNLWHFAFIQFTTNF